MTNTFSVLIFAILTMVTFGCSSPEHKQKVEQAEQRWREVRADVKLQLIRQQYDQGLFEDVIIGSSEVLGLDQNNLVALTYLVRAYMESGRLTDADVAIRSAISIHSRSAELHYLMGTLAERRQQYPLALKYYDKAVILDPGDIDYFIAKIESMMIQGESDRALDILEAEKNRYENNPSLSLLEGHIYSFENDLEKAHLAYHDAYLSFPDNRFVMEYYGVILAQTDRKMEAIEVLSRLHEINQDEEGMKAYLPVLAECYVEINKGKQARKVIYDYAKNNPEDAYGQLVLAKACLMTDDTYSAMRAIQNASNVMPDSSEILFVQSLIHWKREKYSAAKESVLKLLSITPDDVDAICLLGEILAADKEYKDAREQFLRALKIQPGCLWAKKSIIALNRVQS